MAAVLLTEIHDWFESNVFAQLTSQEPDVSIRNMWAATGSYFYQGERICLMGAFALDQTRNRFSSMIRRYFSRWIETLQNALIRGGMKSENAAALAEAAVGNIQGALILARALDDPKVFERALHRLEAELDAGINNSSP
jgi:AcrR family transcriptional regulator